MVILIPFDFMKESRGQKRRKTLFPTDKVYLIPNEGKNEEEKDKAIIIKLFRG